MTWDLFHWHKTHMIYKCIYIHIKKLLQVQVDQAGSYTKLITADWQAWVSISLTLHAGFMSSTFSSLLMISYLLQNSSSMFKGKFVHCLKKANKWISSILILHGNWKSILEGRIKTVSESKVICYSSLLYIIIITPKRKRKQWPQVLKKTLLTQKL